MSCTLFKKIIKETLHKKTPTVYVLSSFVQIICLSGRSEWWMRFTFRHDQILRPHSSKSVCHVSNRLKVCISFELLHPDQFDFNAQFGRLLWFGTLMLLQSPRSRPFVRSFCGAAPGIVSAWHHHQRLTLFISSAFQVLFVMKCCNLLSCGTFSAFTNLVNFHFTEWLTTHAFQRSPGTGIELILLRRVLDL